LGANDKIQPETELSTDDDTRRIGEKVVANGSPRAVVEHFQSTGRVRLARVQPNLN